MARPDMQTSAMGKAVKKALVDGGEGASCLAGQRGWLRLLLGPCCCRPAIHLPACLSACLPTLPAQAPPWSRP